MKVLPLFTSQFSIGKSILTLDKANENSDESGPDSIFSIAKEYGLKQIFLVEDSFGGTFQALKNVGSVSSDTVLSLGFRCNFCSDIDAENDVLKSTTHKNVVFALNSQGYKDLIKFYSKASTDNLRANKPYMDYSCVREFWTENLLLMVPFYDSFLHKNALYDGSCNPDFSAFGSSIVFAIENNDLPFDYLIERRINKYISSNPFDTVRTKSIFYKRREDFDAWATLRLMNNRSFGYFKASLKECNLPNCGSREFCMESWAEQNQ